MIGGWVESVLLYVSQFLSFDGIFEVLELSLLEVDLVGHEVVHRSIGSMINMGVRVHIGAGFSLCSFVIFLFFLYSSPD